MARSLLDAARDLRGLIDENANKAAGGPIPTETIRAMYDAGLYGAMLPEEVGGAGLDLMSCLDVFAEVAYADGSAGWCLMASNAAACYFGVFCDDDLVDRVFGDGIPLVAGQFAPNGQLTPAGDGSWRLNGSFQFGSGMNDAGWAGAGAITQPTDGSEPTYRAVIMPRDEVNLEGNWDVMGLQSTASWDYSVSDVVIPENAMFDFFTPHRYRGGTLFDMGVLPLTSAGHAAWAVGLIRRALDELRVMALTKKRMASAQAMRESEHVLMRLGELEARAASTKTWAYESFRKLEAHYAKGDSARAHDATGQGEMKPCGDAVLEGDARMATAFVTHQGAEIVRDAYLLAGTAGLRDGPLQRVFRDIHAGTQHAVVSDSVTLGYGRASLERAPASLLARD